MENLLKGCFAIILSTLCQTSTIVTLIVSVSLLMVYLFAKKYNIGKIKNPCR